MTLSRSGWCHHKKRCKHHAQADPAVEILQQQLKDSKEQLATKDTQIAELMQLAKKPRTVTNTNNTTNNTQVNNLADQSINVFGKETLDHISKDDMQDFIKDPPSAISSFIKMQMKPKENRNVICPNKKRSMYKMLDRQDDEKVWDYRCKGEVLDHLYDMAADVLEVQADETTPHGARFLAFQARVRDSADGDAKDGGRLYKEQLERIHAVILGFSENRS